MRAALILILLFSAAVIFNNPGLGAEGASAKIDFGQGVSVPVFEGAKDLWGGPQPAEINGIPIKVALFETSSLPADVLAFYKTRLTEQGWEYLLDVSWLTVMCFYNDKEKSHLYIVGSNLFETEDTPATRFEIVLASQSLHMCVSFGPDFQEETAGKDPAFIPRYPGAVRAASITRGEKQGFFAYISRDSIRGIADFYYTNLPKYGWHVDKRDIGLNRLFAWQGTSYILRFSRGRKDSLGISVNFCPDNKVSVILVSYNNVFTGS